MLEATGIMRGSSASPRGEVVIIVIVDVVVIVVGLRPPAKRADCRGLLICKPGGLEYR